MRLASQPPRSEEVVRTGFFLGALRCKESARTSPFPAAWCAPRSHVSVETFPGPSTRTKQKNCPWPYSPGGHRIWPTSRNSPPLLACLQAGLQAHHHWLPGSYSQFRKHQHSPKTYCFWRHCQVVPDPQGPQCPSLQKAVPTIQLGPLAKKLQMLSCSFTFSVGI